MTNQPSSTADYVLGIDLGTNSVGWAIVAQRDGGPAGIVRAGARVFDAGMDVDNKSGKESSRNLARRTARLIRRQHWRRGRRLKKVFRILQNCGLLPQRKVSSPEERQDFINDLDRSILYSAWFTAKIANLGSADPQQLMPYLLRSAALDEPLDPHFLGRALFHLAQRRGFRSGRKEAPVKQDAKGDDEGKVKTGIAELQKSMEASGARTLGEYFSRLNTHAERIRKRWTSRVMYETEFDRVWDAQAAHHPALLTPERKKVLRGAIFFQRPLKLQKNLIGMCELEPEERRAPAFLLVSQRFRLLQRVNDLRVQAPGRTELRLTRNERNKLIEKLELEGDQTFAAIGKLLGLKKGSLNLEEGGETKIPGNRTASQLYAVFGERWLQMPPEERCRVVEYLNAFQNTDKLADAAAKKWNLSPYQAKGLAGVKLEAGYFSYSRRALEKLLPSLEEGSDVADAIRNGYGQGKLASESLNFLPRVEDWREVRNPAVTRSLAELRKVVNAVIREYDKPMEIRIELARDLRQTKAQREKAWKKGRENQRAREKAAKKILDEVGLAQPSGDDIRKVLLCEECNHTCPYTGRTISMAALVGRESQFDIEHIIPFSRSLDNSMANLTLCYHEVNRNVKGNKTPREAYESNPDQFQEILGHVKKFKSDFAKEKLRRFQMTTAEVDEAMNNFTSRQLNDTRYATKLAGDYLSLLYGGRVDADGKLRIRATAGQVTAILRNEWKLNTILQDGPTANGGATPKSRDDHRHHAVDAVVTALTDDGTIQSLSRAAERAPLEHRRRFAKLNGPWDDFVPTVREQIEKIVVSHRPQKKVSGALHEETFYSAPKNGPANVRRVRKPLANISKSEVLDIVDPKILEIVLGKMRSVGTENPADVFADEKNQPYLRTSDGRQIPVKSARVFKKLQTFPIGSGRIARHVASESNHHIEIFAELDAEGNEVEWDGFIVTMKDAYERLKGRVPVIQRDHGLHRKFKFSLSPGEILELDTSSGQRCLYVVRASSVDGPRVALVAINDARQKKQMTKDDYIRKVPDSLRRLSARKVVINPLGEMSEAHD